MHTADLLALFQAPPGDLRALDCNFRHDGYLYATSGHVAVRIEDDPSVDASSDGAGRWAAKIEALLTRYAPADTEFVALEIEPPADECHECAGTGLVRATAVCGDCSGDGVVGFEVGRHDYTVECAECKGSGMVPADEMGECPACVGGGKIYSGDRVLIGRLWFSSRYALRLRRLPAAEFALAAGAPGGPLVFRGVGGGRRYVGLVAPLA